MLETTIYAFIEYKREGQMVCFAQVYLPYLASLYKLLEREEVDIPNEHLHTRKKSGVPQDASSQVVHAYTASASDEEGWAYDVRPWYFRDASWLNADELKARLALFRARYPSAGPIDEYDAMLLVLQRLPDARIVFWRGPRW